MALFRTVGYGGDSGSISDIEKADLVLIVGSNTAESHPVIATRVKSAHKLDGQKLIVSDLREHEMARRADLFLHPKPGTDLIWLNAVTPLSVRQRPCAHQVHRSVGQRARRLRKSLEPFTIEVACAHFGVPEETLKTVARMIADAKAMCILWAMGVTQHVRVPTLRPPFPTCCWSPAITCGREPALIRLRGHNNVQGASDHGAMPNILPGYQSVNDPEVRQRFETGWKVTLPSTKGSTIIRWLTPFMPAS